MRPLARAWRLLLGVLVGAALGSACIHDWDGLEAPEGSGGSGGSGASGASSGGGTGTGTGSGTGTGATCPSTDTSVEAMCAIYCDRVTNCVTNDPSCVSTCQAEMAACPPGARDTIRGCLDAIDYCECSGVCGVGSTFETGFLVCIGTQVSCWDPPHECP